MIRRLRDVSLEGRFFAISLVILFGGALVIGSWVSRAISDGVLNRSAATSALYAESFLGPRVAGQSFEGPLPPTLVEELDALFVSTQFGQQVVSVKLWAPDGTIRYARDPAFLGRRFPVSGSLEKAVNGKVTSHISGLDGTENEFEARHWSRLIETYVPIWSAEENAVIAVAEFYELPDQLLSELQSARLTGWAIVGSATMVMFLLLNGMMRAASRTIRNQNATLAQLTGLHGSTLALSGETRAAPALQGAVDLGAQLVGARYAAVATVDADGQIADFRTTGFDDGTRDRIGKLPEGRGLLAETLKSGTRLRVENVRNHPASVGFPPGHPELKHLLGVPLVHGNTLLGALFLADRADGKPFTAVDEEIVGMFATHVAVVIQNARLSDDLQVLAVERERQHIAREMHDGLAQVLGFVSTKAQAAEQFVRNGDAAMARHHLAELSEAARRVYADIREGIVALQVQSGGGRTFQQVIEEYVDEFRQFAGIEVEVVWRHADHAGEISQVVEVQLIRIIQEALTNVRRHAHARSAVVTLQADGHVLELFVGDDGVGFDPTRLTRGPWPQFGLRAMRERAESVGGTLEVKSSHGTGTVISVRVPGAFEKSGAVHT